MALINCPECKKEVSNKATSCPNCGCPINQKTITENPVPVYNQTRKVNKAAIFGIIGGIIVIGIIIAIVLGNQSDYSQVQRMGKSAVSICEKYQDAQMGELEAFNNISDIFTKMNKLAASDGSADTLLVCSYLTDIESDLANGSSLGVANDKVMIETKLLEMENKNDSTNK